MNDTSQSIKPRESNELIHLRKRLMTTAEKLLEPGFSQQAVAEYHSSDEIFSSVMNQLMMSRQDIFQLIGGDINSELMKDNHTNHLRFIGSVLAYPDPETLVEVIIWVFRAYRSRGFHPTYWSAQLNNWMELMPTQLSQDSWKEILPVYQWMNVNIPIFEKLANE